MSLVAHRQPVGPAEVWSAWNSDPLTWGAVALIAVVWLGGRSRPRTGERFRRRVFAGGMVAMAVAVLSPLDALAATLASAHMVQHLVLTLVAAPLLVIGAPIAAIVRGLPPSAGEVVRRRGRGRGARWSRKLFRRPVAAAAAHALAVWTWHLPGPYDAAVANDLVHASEHLSLLVTAAISWASLIPRGRRRRRDRGLGVLALFGLSTQCGVLGALLTFAAEPLYRSYQATTTPWGLSPLADQQLAGLIMWVPAGGAYLVAAIIVLRSWIDAPPPAVPVPRRSSQSPAMSWSPIHDQRPSSDTRRDAFEVTSSRSQLDA